MARAVKRCGTCSSGWQGRRLVFCQNERSRHYQDWRRREDGCAFHRPALPRIGGGLEEPPEELACDQAAGRRAEASA